MYPKYIGNACEHKKLLYSLFCIACLPKKSLTEVVRHKKKGSLGALLQSWDGEGTGGGGGGGAKIMFILNEQNRTEIY